MTILIKSCSIKLSYNLKGGFKTMFTSSKKETKEMQQQIIESAGKIYNYLSDKGEVTINKLRKDMDLEDNFTYMGLGWLSREDKISYTQKPKSITVKLI